MGLKARIAAVFEWLDTWAFGIPTILKRTFQSFGETNAAESASSIAYYALFSLFPMVLFTISLASSVLRDQTIQQRVLQYIDDFLPTAQDLVNQNIERALELQGAIQIVSLVGLLWAASGVFTILATNINRAWHTAQRRNFVQGRLLGLGIVMSLAVLFILWLIFTTILNLLPLVDVLMFGTVNIYDTYAWSILTQLVPSFFLMIAFINLYRWVPNTKVRWREAVWGALVSVIGFQMITAGFRWFLTSGMARYQVIYGSLGAVIALMLWLYLSSVVVLLGAHLTAAIALKTRLDS
ncbi:MAG: YihY/virulence factor BrkB family protein [Anaerolineaceae bacterium]|nr:YihY/virulence factor BrkB family protein [Anaerolineaceae bacterium]MCB9099377.1 YihY/virulence factor BrkB family protein [Anaerolineales bacterium]